MGVVSLSFARVQTLQSEFPFPGLAMAKMWSYDPDDMSMSFPLNGGGLGDGLILPDKPKVRFLLISGYFCFCKLTFFKFVDE